MLFENIGRHIDAFFNNISAHLRGEVRAAKATYAQAMHDIASAYAADTRRLADATEEIAKHLSVLASPPDKASPVEALASPSRTDPTTTLSGSATTEIGTIGTLPAALSQAQDTLAAPQAQPDAPTPLEPALVAVATPQDQETAPPQQTAYVQPEPVAEQPVAAPVAPTPYLPPQ